MSIYKLIRITQYTNTLKYRIHYYDDIVNVIKEGNDYIIEEWGVVLRPVYDSTKNKLIGFIDA
jgi:hypothetical protein